MSRSTSDSSAKQNALQRIDLVSERIGSPDRTPAHKRWSRRFFLFNCQFRFAPLSPTEAQVFCVRQVLAWTTCTLQFLANFLETYFSSLLFGLWTETTEVLKKEANNFKSRIPLSPLFPSLTQSRVTAHLESGSRALKNRNLNRKWRFLKLKQTAGKRKIAIHESSVHS